MLQERGDCLIRGARIRDQHVNVRDGADQGRSHDPNLAGIRHHDGLLRLMDQGAKGEGLLGFDYGDAAGSVDSTNADKDPVQEDVIQRSDGRVSHERERTRPLHEAARDEGFQAGTVAQFHGNVDGIGDDPNVVPVPQVAGDIGCGGTGGEPDSFVLLNQFCRGGADPALLRRPMLFPVLKERVVTEWFVEQRLDQGYVGSPGTELEFAL